MPASLETSPAKPSARPEAPRPFNSPATLTQSSPLREAIITVAPALTSAVAAMRPMPVAAPVTSAVLPATENSSSR